MNKMRPLGIIFTAIVSLFFVIAIIGWINLYKEPEISVEQIKENEEAAYMHLKEIAVAQQKYIQEDWDNDGEHEYSIFLVHLWKSMISKDGDTKLLDFIPRKLGFATESSTALDGYIFMVLHDYNLQDRSKKPMNYTKEWAVYASPNKGKESGYLNFVINQTGDILVTKTQVIYEHDYPYQALQNDWVQIASIDELKEFQEKLEYDVQE